MEGGNNRIFNDKGNKTKILSNIIYTGYLKDEELASLYNHCKAFIFPSLYEGFGIPPLEALQMGCRKLILSDIEVLKEVYGDIGIFINTRKPQNLDKYDQVTISDEECERIINKYTWDKVAKKIIENIK